MKALEQRDAQENLESELDSYQQKRSIVERKLTQDQFIHDSMDITAKPCVVCQVNKKRCVILDCFHLVVCIRCAYEIQNKECPICRTKITDIRITYD